MRRNEMLTGVKLKKKDDRYFLSLRYRYDDGKDIHDVIIPRVRLCIPRAIPFLHNDATEGVFAASKYDLKQPMANEWWITLDGYSKTFLEPTTIEGHEDCVCIDKVIGKVPPVEMTMKEIEDKLGCRIKIVGGEK